MLSLPPITPRAQSHKQDSLFRGLEEEGTSSPSSRQGGKRKSSVLPRISTPRGSEIQPTAEIKETSGLPVLEPSQSRESHRSTHRGTERDTPGQTFQFDEDERQKSANRVLLSQPSQSFHRTKEERPQSSHDGRNEASSSLERERVDSSDVKPLDGKSSELVNDSVAYSPVRPHSLDSGIGRSHSGQSKIRVQPFKPSVNVQQSLRNRRGSEDASEVESISESSNPLTNSQPQTQGKIQPVRKSHTQVDTKVLHPGQSNKTRLFKKSRTHVETADTDKSHEQPLQKPILAPRERSKAYKALTQEIRNVKTPRTVAKQQRDARKSLMDSYTFRTARSDPVPLHLRSVDRREKQTQEAVHQILQKENHLRISQKKKIEKGKETSHVFHPDVAGAITTYTRQTSNAHAPQRSHSVVGRSTESSVLGRRCHSERPVTRQLTEILRKAERSYDQRSNRNKRQYTFLTQVTELQKQAARERQREAVRRRQLAADSKSRQAWQLYFLRDKFEKERRKRFAGQYVTSRVLRHEIVDRHQYGLPDTLSASGRKSTVSRPSRNSTGPPRRSTGSSSLSHYQRARKTFRYMFEEPRGPRPFQSLSRTRTHITKTEGKPAIAMTKVTERILQEANQLLAASLDIPPGSERHISEAPKFSNKAPQPKAQRSTVHQKVARSLQKTIGPKNATSQSTNSFVGGHKTISQPRGNHSYKTPVPINAGGLRNPSYKPTSFNRGKNENRSHSTKPSVPPKTKGKSQSADHPITARVTLNVSNTQSRRYNGRKTPLASTLNYDVWARKQNKTEEGKEGKLVESNKRPSKSNQVPERQRAAAESGPKEEPATSDAVKDAAIRKKVVITASKAGEPKSNTASFKDPKQEHEPRIRQSKQQPERIVITPTLTSTPKQSQNRKYETSVKPAKAKTVVEPVSSVKTENKSSKAAQNSIDPPKKTVSSLPKHSEAPEVTSTKPQPPSSDRRGAVRSKLAKSMTHHASPAPSKTRETTVPKGSDTVSHPLTFKPANTALDTKQRLETKPDNTPKQTVKNTSSIETENVASKAKAPSKLDTSREESRDFGTYPRKRVSPLGYSAPHVVDDVSDDDSLLEADDIWERAIRKYNIRLDEE